MIAPEKWRNVNGSRAPRILRAAPDPGAAPRPSVPPECGPRADQASARCRRPQKCQGTSFVKNSSTNNAFVRGDPRVFGEAQVRAHADPYRPPIRNLKSSRYRASHYGLEWSTASDRDEIARRLPRVLRESSCRVRVRELFSSGTDSLPTTATSILRSRNEQPPRGR